MTDQTTYQQEKQPAALRVRRSLEKSRARLAERGNLLALVLSSILVMVMAFAAIFLMGLASFVLTGLTKLPIWATNGISIALAALVLLFVVLPMIVGRVRLALLMVKGETPLVKETFYYFTSPRRYGRALLVGLLFAACLAVSAALVAGAVYGVYVLYEEILVVFLVPLAANLMVALGYHLVAAVALAIFFVSGIWLPCTLIATSEEGICVLRAFGRGFALGGKRFGCFLRYLWQVLLRFLISLPTIGVLWLLYFENYALIGYAGLVCDLEQ